jgi:putative ABC transport system permease protein
MLQDARYGLRTLLRSPGFTCAALLTLALGIGANAAIFSFVNAILLRPLPYPDPDRLVMVGDDNGGSKADNVGYATFDDIRNQTSVFESMAAVRGWSPTLVISGEAERVPAMRVSASFFSMLGVRPALGRDFRADDDHPDRWRVLMISDGLWRRRFSADPAVIGRTVRMNDRDYQIVGVLPADFEPLISARFYKAAEMWAPLGYASTLPDGCRSCQHLKAIGRLRAGVPAVTALGELNAIRRQLRAAFPRDYAPGDMALVDLHGEVTGSVRRVLLVLLGAVGLVLLIACANVANLLLARGVGRAREMSVRSALGASRGRLVRQMVTESLILGAAGGCLGVAAASVSVRTLGAVAPVMLPRLERVSVDGTVLAFATGLSLLTGLGVGVVPAIRASSFAMRDTLMSQTRSTVRSLRGSRLLVITDLAIALVLLVGAGLMLRTVAHLMRVDPGFDPRGVMTLQFSLVGTAYREDEAVVAFGDRLLERVRALPGVEAAALAGQIPMGGNYDTWGFHIVGRGAANPSEDPSAQRYSVTPAYFDVMRIPLRKGRLITDQDRARTEPVMLISESTAKNLWPGEDPIGRQVQIGGMNRPPRTIVGIVGDVNHTTLTEPLAPQMYLPQAQLTDSFLVLTVRAPGVAAAGLLSSIRNAIGEMDASVPIYEVAPLENLLDRSYADRRFLMGLLGGFAMLSLLLASIGLYGVVSQMITQRTRELGIRVALGARPADVLQLVFGGGLRMVIAGLGVGLLVSFMLTGFLGTLLVEVRPADPATIAVAASILAGVALVAHWIPARRALRVDPVDALRCE